MRYMYMVLMILCSSLADAQFTLVSFSPADNSTNVPLTTSVSLTFSEALDTTYSLGPDAGIFTNIQNSTGRYYSSDRRTVTFDVTLSPATVYIVCIYQARAQGGATLQTPVGFMFTTGSSFPPYSVSGNVYSGATGVSPANALVILSTTPITGGEPNPVSGTIADGAGGFILPYVANGTYYPIAAKDANGDGEIDPSSGDVVAFSDPVVVNNSSVTGVNLTFFSMANLPLAAALSIADSISATLPQDKSLRFLSGYDVDTIGRADDWEFIYLKNSGAPQGYKIIVGSMNQRWEALDSTSCWWLVNARPMTDPGSAASSSTFLANVEDAGGREFRRQAPGGNLEFNSQVNLGDLRWTNCGWLVHDSTLYWGATYSFGYDSSNHWVNVLSKTFIGDYSTGTIILVSDVKSDDNAALPMEVVLQQNYPNPFNPSTLITFSIPREEWTMLKVYNIIGQEVSTLVQGLVPAGQYTIQFDAGDLPSGIYFYRLTSGLHTFTNRMILLR